MPPAAAAPMLLIVFGDATWPVNEAFRLGSKTPPNCGLSICFLPLRGRRRTWCLNGYPERARTVGGRLKLPPPLRFSSRIGTALSEPDGAGENVDVGTDGDRSLRSPNRIVVIEVVCPPDVDRRPRDVRHRRRTVHAAPHVHPGVDSRAHHRHQLLVDEKPSAGGEAGSRTDLGH